MAQRVTQVPRLVLTTGTPTARVTQVVRSTLTSGTPTARVTQVARLVLVRNVAPDGQSSSVAWRD